MVKNFSTAANDKCATPYTRGISIHQKSSNSLEIPARNVTNELADFGKHSVHCLTDNFEQIRFEVNQTTSCKFKTSNVDCHFLQKSLRNALSFTSTYICNCGICDIPITVQQDPVIEYNSSVCLIPNHVTVFLSYGKGIVTGAHVRYHWRKYEKRETLITLEKTIIFLPNKSPSITKSRFSQQRGRFHCPSEVTCWRELWFPFTEWTLTPMEQQLVCLVAAFFIVFLTK